MPVELRPFGVACNLRCRYCYQNEVRGAMRQKPIYEVGVLKKALEKERRGFTLFGGEPLLVPEKDLEQLWSWGYAKFRSNGIQTNGVLINENHIRMFKKYRVGVGISIDGPDDLNDARWAGSLKATREATAKINDVIRRLVQEGLYPSLIVTLHRANASEEKLPRLTSWLEELDALGIRSARLHILEVDDPGVREQFTLSTEENIRAFLHLANVEKRFKTMQFDVFKDMRRLLVGRDRSSTCIWTGCDPYTTAAVTGVEATGRHSNCGRTNKEGIDFNKADAPGYERYLTLYYTSQEHGGCQGCRYFLMCKGQCPGTAINGDWRNRSEHCAVWKALFEHFEKELFEGTGEKPLPDEVRRALEDQFIKAWSRGQNTFMENLLPALRPSLDHSQKSLAN